MKKIFLLDKPKRVVDMYIARYRTLYEELYSDTGLFVEQEILEYYRREAKSRNIEIAELLQEKLSPDIIVGYHIEKGLHISWRSKDIWVKWRDDADTRTITELEIR